MFLNKFLLNDLYCEINLRNMSRSLYCRSNLLKLCQFQRCVKLAKLNNKSLSFVKKHQVNRSRTTTFIKGPKKKIPTKETAEKKDEKKKRICLSFTER